MSEFVPDEQPASISSLLVAQAEAKLRAWPIPEACAAFVRAMQDANLPFDVAYFLEKPWKWAREYAIWDDAIENNLDDETLWARLDVAS